MREWLGEAIRKVTLEAIYKLIEERTQWIVEKQEKDKQELLGHIQRLEEKQEKDKQELLGHIQRLEEKQEKDKKELQKLIQDTKQELLGYIHRLEERQEKFQEEVRAEFRHINQRFDTVVNMLLSLSLSMRKEE